MKFDLIILIIISFVSVESRRITPKADDLKDHFGYSPDYSPYGPSELKTVLLPTSIDPPFTEYYSEPIRIIRRKPIHLINPEIAKPKIHVVTHHRGIIRKKAFLGHRHSHHSTSSIDNNGVIVDHEITVKEPVYANVDEPYDIEKHDFVNLDGSGNEPTVIKYHGVD